MTNRLLKPFEICQVLGGISKVKYYELIAAGRITMVPLGERLRVCSQDAIDALITELAIEREAAQALLDAHVDLRDVEASERALRGKTYPPTSRSDQQRFLVDRAVRMALDLQRARNIAADRMASREAKAAGRPRVQRKERAAS